MLPRPTAVVTILWEKRLLFWMHTRQTLFETLAGLTLATVAASLTATIMLWVPALKKALYPLITLSQTIPMIALAPLLTVWLGFGWLPKLVVIVLTCYFPIVVSLSDGFAQTDRQKTNLLLTLGASRRQRFRWLDWPAALPYFFTGLRMAATYAVLAAVVAEWLGARAGLGVLLTRSAKSFQTAQLFATVVIISLLSLALLGLVNLIAARALRWQQPVVRSTYQESL